MNKTFGFLKGGICTLILLWTILATVLSYVYIVPYETPEGWFKRFSDDIDIIKSNKRRTIK